MGYGGDLLMTAAMHAYRSASGKRAALVFKPHLTDLLCGRLYDDSRTITSSPIYVGNPDVLLPRATRTRNRVLQWMDRNFTLILSRLGLEPRLDRFLGRACLKLSRSKSYRLVYVDSIRFSYAQATLPDRMHWKPTPNAVAAILTGLDRSERPAVVHPQLAGNLYGLEQERQQAAALLDEVGCEPKSFIVIEPDTNRDWFGELRAWPMEHWRSLVAALQSRHPAMPIVQVGVGAKPLEGVIDLRGRTTFREAAAILEKAALFIGTEGGLMHAAAAVQTQSVIIWGGVTLPTFAGYPQHHVILFNLLDCAPCGYLNACPYDAACIRGIAEEAVISDVLEALDLYKPGIRQQGPHQ